MSSDLIYLGEGIYLYNGNEVDIPQIKGRYRFLNCLWLPSVLSELTDRQIFILNRYRESVMNIDGQFLHANKARSVLREVFLQTGAGHCIEIGCGLFPLELNSISYVGVDIDPEAISYLRRQGKTACTPSDLVNSYARRDVDCILSANAMHFPISKGIIDDLCILTSDSAIFCFNIISDNSSHILNIISVFSEFWPYCFVVKAEKMARREYFFVLGRNNSYSLAKVAVNTIKNKYEV